jgi:hypothetical protein
VHAKINKIHILGWEAYYKYLTARALRYDESQYSRPYLPLDLSLLESLELLFLLGTLVPPFFDVLLQLFVELFALGLLPLIPTPGNAER